MSGRGHGHRHPHRGHKVSKTTRAKLSKAERGKHRTAAQRLAQSKRQKGRHHKGHTLSAAARAKLSARMKGRRIHHRGHKLTAAQKAKLSARMKGRHLHHKGHKLSAAAKAKIAAKLAGRHHKGQPSRHPATHHLAHRAAGHRTSMHTAGAHPWQHAAGHTPRHLRIRAHAGRRGRIYPSHFAHSRSRLKSRFNPRKRRRATSFAAGRRRMRKWK